MGNPLADISFPAGACCFSATHLDNCRSSSPVLTPSLVTQNAARSSHFLRVRHCESYPLICRSRHHHRRPVLTTISAPPPPPPDLLSSHCTAVFHRSPPLYRCSVPRFPRPVSHPSITPCTLPRPQRLTNSSPQNLRCSPAQRASQAPNPKPIIFISATTLTISELARVTSTKPALNPFQREALYVA